MLPLIVLFASYAEAAEAGALRGQITDGDGLPLPDAVVTLTGSEIAGELVAQTDGDGRFRFLSVPIGTHNVVISRARFTTVRTMVTVRLGETAYLEGSLQIANVAGAEIVVEATRHVVDTTSSGISANLDREALDNLPTGRSYQDAVNLLPGVYGNVDTSDGGGGDGNPSVRGEGQYGNNYFVDGVSTRDPTTKTFGNNVNFDAIEEIQVFTDGAPAEYGQFTGMLVNVVTRDGGDEHHGSAAYYLGAPLSFRPETCADNDQSCLDRAYLILDPTIGEEVPEAQPKYYDMTMSLTAGGPIKKETLWYFAALDLSSSAASYPGMPVELPSVERGMMGWAKFTWFPTGNLTMRATLAGSNDNLNNYYTTPQYAPEAQLQYHSDDASARLNVNWTPSASSSLEAGFGYLQSHIDTRPQSGSEDNPGFVNLDTGEYYGNADSFDLNTRRRVGGEVQFTQLVPKALGSHKIKAGVEAWVLDDSRELIYTGPGDGRFYRAEPSAGLPCTEEAGYTDCAGYTEYDQVGAMKHRGLTFSAFVQDDWQPVSPLTLNLGIRVDRESLYPSSDENDAFILNRDPIVDQWMPAPRLGAAWDVTQDSRTLLSVNAGRYYDVNGNSFSEWGDSRSAYSYYEYTYDPAAGGYVLTWVQDSSVSPSEYSEDLQPAHMDKLTVAAERELIPLLSVGLRGFLSKTAMIPEDININDSNWLITNPGENKFRTYRGAELVVERAFDNGWQLMGSYTLSESKGHLPGQFEIANGGQSGSDGNGVGVYLDDVNESGPEGEGLRQAYFDAGYGWYLDGLNGLGRTDDDAGYYGYLPYQSFHMAKVSGSYTFDQGTTLGLSYMFDSGHAWEKHTFVPLYGDYFGFGEGRGTRWMPPVHYVDIRVAHAIAFNDTQSLELSLDFFNVPNFDTPITYYSNDDQNFGKTLYRQSPRSVQAGLKFTY